MRHDDGEEFLADGNESVLNAAKIGFSPLAPTANEISAVSLLDNDFAINARRKTTLSCFSK